jgi:nucleoside 2-deoxyribosyltransferase
MKNFFIAYRHTGENILELEIRIRTIEIALAAKNIKAYATLNDEEAFVANNISPGKIMETAFQKISAMDGLFVLIMDSNKSEGQLMEVGYALALKKPVIIAQQENAQSYVSQLTNLSITFSDLGDLTKKIMALDI